MKSFDLETALAGKPVQLRNGRKAIVYYRIPDEYLFKSGQLAAYPLYGIIFDEDGYIEDATACWKDNGNYGQKSSAFDIIGMWQESELTQEELFEKALKEKLPLRYKGLDVDYANVYVVAKSMSGSYILEWKDGTDTCVSILSNLPKFEWYLASEKPVKEIRSIGLPKPFTPKKGQKYYSISPDYDGPEECFANVLKHPSIRNGNCFRSEADAQKWIDFMKSHMEK